MTYLAVVVIGGVVLAVVVGVIHAVRHLDDDAGPYL